MATLVVNKQYDDGQILTEAQLDAAFDSISTFFNVTGIGGDNIQDGGIGPSELATSSVTETKIASDAVTTAKILDGSVTLAKLATLLQQSLNPVGTLISSASAITPAGYLVCDGSLVSRTTYAPLFAAIGTNFGGGDGSTTFNIPDARGQFLRYWCGNAAVRDPDTAIRTANVAGGNTGNLVGSQQAAEYASHIHPGIQGNISNTLVVAGGAAGTGGYNTPISGPSGTESLKTFPSGGNETRPVNLLVNLFIKY